MKECVVGVLMVECHTGGSEQALVQLLLREWRAQDDPKSPFTRREGYPSKGVNPS